MVTGAGPIGIMTALAALAGGCSSVMVADLVDEKLAIAATYPGIVTINIRELPLAEAVREATGGWGADVLFAASGAAAAYRTVQDTIRPGGCLVAIGMSVEPLAPDISAIAAKEIRIETVSRYANVFERALAMIASGGETFPFDQSIAASERVAEARPGDVKLQIKL